MRQILIIAFLSGLVFSACKKQKDPVTEEKIDFNTASASLLNEIKPRLTGSWKVKGLTVNPFKPHSVSKDTLLTDFAVLDITSLDYYSENNTTTSYIAGTLNFRNKRYPVGFRIHANPDRVFHNTGPQAFALFEFNFPVGTHLTEAEEQYLYDLTLIGDNYTIEVSPDGKKMRWKGLNRAIKNIDFVKLH